MNFKQRYRENLTQKETEYFYNNIPNLLTPSKVNVNGNDC